MSSLLNRRQFLATTSAALSANLPAQEAPVRVFRGIAFAQPPIGSLRFASPSPLLNWDRNRPTAQFAAAAPQTGLPNVRQSEDCLYLNIWAPEGKGPFPVFVWIHGGGFTGGYSFDPVFNGSNFARDGIVCVTVAYRLGVLGFLGGSPNNGVLDLIAALQWVQANIAQVGGDPERVTLGGESAGAKLTGLLMGVPEARPLFHQMISESGGAERIWQKDQAAKVAEGFGEFPNALPAILTKQQEFLRTWPQHFPLRAAVDGKLFPRLPIGTIQAGSTKGKRLLIGTNRDESASFIGPHPQSDPTAADLGNTSLERFREIYRAYSQVYPNLTVEQRRIRAVTAEEYWVPTVRLADAHMQGGGKAWMYRLDWPETTGPLTGYARHGLDVPMVWSAAHPIHRAWSAFIKGETPSAAELPAWPNYEPKSRPTMILDKQNRVELTPGEAELRLWD